MPVCIGEDPDDPVFCVTDLLPHLATEQMTRKATEVVKGEDLNILIGSRPLCDDDEGELVKLNILRILHEKYGMTEADFLSAELEAVPAFRARDLGFDRSLIGAYGHDDRVCAYPALTAILEAQNPAFTAVTILADKEEIGSEGNTGMQSAYLRYFIADIAAAFGAEARHVLGKSVCLSADVNAAFDPIYPEVLEPRNSAYLNRGVVLTKYTGSKGKSGTSDASAEIHGLRPPPNGQRRRVLADRGTRQGRYGRRRHGGDVYREPRRRYRRSRGAGVVHARSLRSGLEARRIHGSSRLLRPDGTEHVIGPRIALPGDAGVFVEFRRVMGGPEMPPGVWIFTGLCNR